MQKLTSSMVSIQRVHHFESQEEGKNDTYLIWFALNIWLKYIYAPSLHGIRWLVFELDKTIFDCDVAAFRICVAVTHLYIKSDLN